MKLNLACCLIGVCFVGCTPSQPAGKKTNATGNSAAQPHEHESVTSLPIAMKQLSAHVQTIAKAFEEKKPDDAHDALHDIGYLLKSIPALAKDMSDDKKSAVMKSVGELKESFDALDDMLHGGPETPYSKVEERITTAMANLRTAIE